MLDIALFFYEQWRVEQVQSNFSLIKGTANSHWYSLVLKIMLWKLTWTIDIHYLKCFCGGHAIQSTVSSDAVYLRFEFCLQHVYRAQRTPVLNCEQKLKPKVPSHPGVI